MREHGLLCCICFKYICINRVYFEYQTNFPCGSLDIGYNYSCAHNCNFVEDVSAGEADNCRLADTWTVGGRKYMNITYYLRHRQNRSNQNQTAASQSDRDDRT